MTLAVVLASCGPSLSEPSSQSVTGRWHSATRVGVLSEIFVDLQQNADGTVKGKWSANLSRPNPSCPPDLGLSPTGGDLTGTNTVLEIRLALIGAGDFQGQFVSGDSLKGSIDSCSAVLPIGFSRVSNIPGG